MGRPVVKDRGRVWRWLRAKASSYWHGESGRRIVALLLFVGALLFMILAVVGDWDTLLTFPWQFDWKYLAAFAVMHSLALGTMFVPWHLMMRHLTTQEDWQSDLSIYSLSILARRIPSPLWYVGGRAYFYQRRQVPSMVVLSASGLEAALIALSGLVSYILLLPWYTFTQPWPWQLIVGAWAILVLVLVLRPNALIDLGNLVLRLLGRPPVDVTVGRRNLLLWGAMYLATWLLDGVGLYFAVSVLLPSQPPLPDIIGVSTTYALVGLTALVLPGGFGLKELAMSALLNVWIPLSAGIAISISYRLAQTLIEAFWALVTYWIARRSTKEAREPVPR